jgi:predicted lipoprotein
MKKDMRSELAIERDKWFESEEGKKCLDAKSLGDFVSHEYLKNRLEFAFLAGAVANEKAREVIAKKISSQLTNGE